MTSLPLFPTTVIGSYSLPRWLEFVRDEHRIGNLTDEELEEAHDNAVKSCLKDQELAGVDIVTDGELRRETMVYFFNAHVKGFRLYGPPKPIGTLHQHITMPDPVVESKVERGDLGAIMARHFRYAQAHTAKKVKVCVTGPHMLTKRAWNEAYNGDDRALCFDLAEVLNADLKQLVSAGCDFIQIDEPVFVGYPDEVRQWAVTAFNRMVEGVNAKITLHVCYGNYQRTRLFPGTYRDLFPWIIKANASQFVFEFAVNDFSEFQIFKDFPPDRELGVGVIDVKSDNIETPEQVATRIRKAMEIFPPEKLFINPDCGLKFTPRRIAFAKLKAMCDGAEIVRREIEGK